MRKITALALLGAPLAVLALCSSPAPEAPARVLSWQDAIPQALRVASHWSGGSGVPIACKPTWDGQWDVFILTCKHVVDHSTDLSGWKVDSPEQDYGRPQFVSQHPDLDASVVRVTVPFYVQPIEVRRDHPDMGERVWAMGYPMVNNRSITDGWIGDFERMSAPIFPGNSGGPVVDSSGRLVGIVTAIGLYGGRHYVLHDSYFQSTGPMLAWLNFLL